MLFRKGPIILAIFFVFLISFVLMLVCLRNWMRWVKKLSYTSQKTVSIKIIFMYRETHISCFVHTLYNSLSLSYITRQDHCGCVHFLQTLPTITANYLHRGAKWTTIKKCMPYTSGKEQYRIQHSASTYSAALLYTKGHINVLNIHALLNIKYQLMHELYTIIY